MNELDIIFRRKHGTMRTQLEKTHADNEEPTIHILRRLVVGRLHVMCHTSDETFLVV